MIKLTYWQDPIVKRTPNDFDEIKTINLKSVKEIPNLIKNRPPHCTAISTQHSAFRLLKNGDRTNFFKFIWNGATKLGYCPTCGREL